MTCNWCNPSGPLTGKRCRECQRVYDLHLAAEDGDDSAATRWIWQHAETLRSPLRDDIYARQQGESTMDCVPIVPLEAMLGGLRRKREHEC